MAMKNIRDVSTRLLHATIDKLLGVNSQQILNVGIVPGSIDGDIAVSMRTIIDQLKMEGFDTEKGLVNYESLKGSANYKRYKKITASLHDFDLSSLQNREEKLAFWINLYNSLIVDAVITYGIKNSIWEAGYGFFRKIAYDIGGLRYSADDIEHGILRGNRHHPYIPLPQFAQNDPRIKYTIIPFEPRIHFTLVCASRSCPLITVYHASDVEEELEMATNSFINGGSVIVKPNEGSVSLSRIFKWYQSDFGGRYGVISFVLRYLKDGLDKDFLIENINKVRIQYQHYDWSLNHY